MEMPTHCMDCPFMVSRDNDDCILQSAEANENFENWEQMKAGCPLIPVPEHGDLKDVSPFDVLAWKGIPDGYENTFADGVHWLAEKLDAAPVVIPADEEGEG